MRFTAIVALALAVGFGVWVVLRNHDKSSPTTVSTVSRPTSASSNPNARPLLTAASPSVLSAIASSARHPVYWAGRRRGVTYELTRTTDGRLYVRYLPKGVRVGNRTGQYLLIGTYPVAHAYRAVQRAAKEHGATTFRLGRGGLAVVNSSAPKNVYFAYPNVNYQVEVFDPHPRVARRLVASGAIRPIR